MGANSVTLQYPRAGRPNDPFNEVKGHWKMPRYLLIANRSSEDDRARPPAEVELRGSAGIYARELIPQGARYGPFMGKWVPKPLDPSFAWEDSGIIISKMCIKKLENHNTKRATMKNNKNNPTEDMRMLM
ncbi:unnamed protein product [Nezara viridula]|uniref:Uncharacterized protein n=1 Tax=Nezara viridula TaxID=85310 RepID=A0A9P0HD65_NEZVI|nr:unnamed protein product [Nezara viridula]